MKKKVIVFYGKKGSGKDTCYELTKDIIENETNLTVNKLSFAGKVKDIVWDVFGNEIKDRERIYGEIDKKEEPIEGWEIPENIDFPEKYWTGRRLLQWYGTDVCRNVYGNVWVDFLAKDLKNSKEDIICITDCRFKNEYDMLNSLSDFDVYFIKIIKETSDNSFSGHASEQDMEDFKYDLIIRNDGDFCELSDALKISMINFINIINKGVK